RSHARQITARPRQRPHRYILPESPGTGPPLSRLDRYLLGADTGARIVSLGLLEGTSWEPGGGQPVPGSHFPLWYLSPFAHRNTPLFGPPWSLGHSAPRVRPRPLTLLLR